MLTGKAVRLERIMDRNDGRTIIVPMDHGVTVGPIFGLVDLRETVNQVAEGGANAVLMHKGVPRCSHRQRGRDIGLIMHLSASTEMSPFPNAKTLVGGVEDALKLGADGVSVHINLGDDVERHMLAELGRLTSSAADWGMPVIAMMYARGPKVADQYAPEVVAHCARLGMELGADVVKVNYTGDPETFERVTECCCIPVVIAGGPRMDDDLQLLRMAHDSLAAGGAGLSVGRNIFQHREPGRLAAALEAIVHQGASVEHAQAVLAGEDSVPG
jgi:class I fructose-bisphosphate aldolase